MGRQAEEKKTCGDARGQWGLRAKGKRNGVRRVKRAKRAKRVKRVKRVERVNRVE